MSQIIPVEVELNVAESVNQYELAVADNSVPVPLGVSTQIVSGTTEEYAGPYSVTPSESAQTLATTDLKMTDDVTVDAIPSDYVGSAVPRRTKNDITITKIVMPGGVQTPVAIAAKGYYESNTTKDIPTGTATTPATSITANPTVSVDSNGLVAASVSVSQSVTPTVNEGYVIGGTAGTVSVQGSSTLQISTQAAKTITPTETEQTAVAAQKFTTGEVKVAAIPSDYIGSEVPQKSSSDLTVSGATVTAPAGYYAEAATKTIGNATLSPVSVNVSPDISVDANGLVTASKTSSTFKTPVSSAGYAKTTDSVQVTTNVSNTYQLPTLGATTYTPGATAQEIAAQQYLTGKQTIAAIAPPYYDMGGANAWLGADATLVQTFTLANVKLSATDFNTWTPSTTAADILATRTAGTFTASDMPDYDYWVLWETKIPIEYLSGSTNKAKGLYLSAFHVQALIRRASSYANLQAGNANSNVNLSAFTGGNFYRYYNATQDNLTYTNNTSYGFYATATANTISSTTAASPTITLKTPKVTARCSTTYMSTGNAAVIDKANTVISQKCTVYKVKASAFMRGVWSNVMRMVQEIDPA